MRWKLIVGFAGAFTLIFAFISIWIYQYTSSTAYDRLVEQLRSTTVGGAQTLDPALFTTLISTVPAVPDPSNQAGFGWPSDQAYSDSATELLHIQLLAPESYPYTYFRDAADGELYFAASVGYFLDPPNGAPYRAPIRSLVSAGSYAAMEQGLKDTVEQPVDSDAYGSWLSSYTPIRDATGASIGALGVDYSIAYLDQVQSDLRRELFPVLGVAYLALLLLVIYVSNILVRPLQRLTGATRRVAEGEYDLELTSIVETRFPDEMAELAESVEVMAGKVAARERSLTREVQRLRVEIDHARREESVQEIVESEFFSDLTAKAEQMRRRMRSDPSHP
jgi:HAMP domain-containing protein